MENKLIWKEEIEDGKVKLLIVNDEDIKIDFENGKSIEFSGYHGQNCCEHVYADFSIVNYYKDAFKDKKIKSIEVKGVIDMGFLLCFNVGYEENIKIFIPCYNSQNSYYSDDLALVIKHNGMKVEIDISEMVEDLIN